MTGGSNIERFGVFLPSFVWPSDGPERARGILDFAREVENAGFDSIFITDHLFAAKQFYSVSFLEPLTALSLVAGVTERVKLGTSVMVMPIREPVLLAKQLATMQFLSNNRVVLGAGIGWYPPEYAATGVKKSERGPRTDEILDIIVPLLEGKTVTYQGRYLLDRGRAHRAPVQSATGGLDRRRLPAGRPRVARSPPPRRGGEKADPGRRGMGTPADLPARGHRTGLGGAAGLLQGERPRSRRPDHRS